MDTSRYERVKALVVSVAAVWTGGWLLFYSQQELRRHAIIRKRKRRHAERLKAGQTLQADRERFASLSIAGRYANPFSEWREQGAWEWAAHKLLYEPLIGHVYPFWQLRTKGKRRPIKTLETETPDLKAIEGRTDAIAATWFGQSTVLLQLDGLRILLDPVFSNQLAPPLGPRRQHPLPAQLAELGPIDLVVISHAHYDHLDFDVVDQLRDSTRWIVPLGLRRSFIKRGVTRVTELDWWSDTSFKFDNGAQLKITGLPTMHWSARTPFDVNQSLWSSFVIQGSKTAFHNGDTGLCLELYQAIGRHFNIDLALLPIGSYSPRWYMSIQHVSPDDAVQIHRAIGSKRSIGVHWGSFVMSCVGDCHGAYAHSDESLDQPPIDLARALQERGVDSHAFTVEPLGRTIFA